MRDKLVSPAQVISPVKLRRNKSVPGNVNEWQVNSEISGHKKAVKPLRRDSLHLCMRVSENQARTYIYKYYLFKWERSGTGPVPIDFKTHTAGENKKIKAREREEVSQSHSALHKTTSGSPKEQKQSKQIR